MISNNPFVLYELDFDAEMFKKYYGSIENPGIYAIPEDDVDPAPNSNTQQLDGDQNQVPNNDQDSSIAQRAESRDDLIHGLASVNGQQPDNSGQLVPPQLSPNDQAAVERELEPIKKFFLLNKLYQLSHLLKSNLLSCDELDTVLKFGINLSYNTLQILAVNIINNLKMQAQAQEQEGNGAVSVQNI